MNRAGLPGVRFVPVQYTPSASVFKGKLCRGVNMIVTDREALRSVDVGITIALALQRFHAKEFGLEKFNKLLVHEPTLEAVRDRKRLNAIKELWASDLDQFLARREKYLLYR